MRYTIPIIAVLLIVAAAVSPIAFKMQSRPKPACPRCNVLLIDFDILRADDLPCYGYPRNTMPNLCAFADKSLLFTDNYSTANFTLPSQFSTITALYPAFHRVRTEFIDTLPPQIPTLAETLQKAGYQTVLAGISATEAWSITVQNGGTRGYDKVRNDTPLPQLINELSKNGKPWFIHYYYGGPHLPYLLPDGARPIENMTAPKGLPVTKPDFDLVLNAYLQKNYTAVFNKKALEDFGQKFTTAGNPKDTSILDLFYAVCSPANLQIQYCSNAWQPRYNAYMQFINPARSEDKEFLRLMYDSILNSMDKDIGAFLLKFSSVSPEQRTVVVVSSDHGEAFGEHGTFSHDPNYHTELFYIPLIIHAPDTPPKRINRTTSLVDIFPTMLDLVQIEAPAGLQGTSLLAYINNPSFDPSVFTISENYQVGTVLQNRDWLYYLPVDATDSAGSILFNKRTDPKEHTNIAAANPQLVQKLYRQTRVYTSYESSAKQLPVPTLNIDPEKLQ